MLDKILFWTVLVWMIAMLVLAIIAVRDVWRDAAKADPDDDEVETAAPSRSRTDASNPES